MSKLKNSRAGERTDEPPTRYSKITISRDLAVAEPSAFARVWRNLRFCFSPFASFKQHAFARFFLGKFATPLAKQWSLPFSQDAAGAPKFPSTLCSFTAKPRGLSLGKERLARRGKRIGNQERRQIRTMTIFPPCSFKRIRRRKPENIRDCPRKTQMVTRIFKSL